MTTIEDIIRVFSPISLDEMGKVKLMNRIDTKFVTDHLTLLRLLELAQKNYMAQQIGDKFNMPYYTCYFDTPDVDMFYQHQRGKKNRQKIRTRFYEGSASIPFLEIKAKNNKGRTQKKRILMENGQDLLAYSDFLNNNSRYCSHLLSPQIENHFFRITLVNFDLTERITIDTDLQFYNPITNTKIALPNLGIIEWKRDGNIASSPLKELLFNLRIHESGFSKYCVGMAITNPLLRQNKLKKKLRLIYKINPF